jgi:hypothetical protein
VEVVFEHDVGIVFQFTASVSTCRNTASALIKVPVGNKVDRKGHPLTIKLSAKGTAPKSPPPWSQRLSLIAVIDFETTG